MSDLDTLLAIMSRLRDPNSGCEWDLAQTYDTITPHTIEEAYEVLDAIQRKDFEGLKEELGDLLFQIVFYSQLSLEKNRFEFSDVVNSICEKMIRRHPKIFEEENQGQESTKELNNLSWEDGYKNVLEPIAKLSACFHQTFDLLVIKDPAITKTDSYKEALLYLLLLETSCFRYWGQGRWTEYAKTIFERGE